MSLRLTLELTIRQTSRYRAHKRRRTIEIALRTAERRAVVVGTIGTTTGIVAGDETTIARCARPLRAGVMGAGAETVSIREIVI